ncbi:MAG: FitA-like ribbon-helix-helix domain-containing protein [Dehalococcoidia bacterium]
MPNMLIRDVPPEVHEQLTRTAASEGRSLQHLLLQHLEEIVARQSLRAILDEAERTATGNFGFAEAIEAIEMERERR